MTVTLTVIRQSAIGQAGICCNSDANTLFYALRRFLYVQTGAHSGVDGYRIKP